MKKVLLLLTLLILIVAAVLYYSPTEKYTVDNICSIEGGWVGVVQTCTCNGQEKEVKNDLYRDGDRITICIGVIENISKPQNAL